MFDVGLLLVHWGYLALFLSVVLGNLGLPLPETYILWVAGFLVWQRRFSLPCVVAVGVLAAILGDNCAYWVGRRYGQTAVARYGYYLWLTPERFGQMRQFLARHGSIGVFVARFVTGLRFLAGPVAGSGGLAPRSFLVPNVLAALIYVPLMVAEGYAASYGVGQYLTHVRQGMLTLQRALIAGALLAVLAALAWHAWPRHGSTTRQAEDGPRLSRPPIGAYGPSSSPDILPEGYPPPARRPRS